MEVSNDQALWTVKRLLEWTTGYLRKHDVDQPRLCAELLLADTLGWQRIDLYVRYDQQPAPDQLRKYRELVRRCGEHEPVAYLTGKAHFYSMELTVAPGVLIPRPETETLVTEAVSFLRYGCPRPQPHVLDLGTGSGCIAIAIASHCIEANILAVDQQSEALEIARQNIQKHDLQKRITLLESDWFSGLENHPQAPFDLIVSNPPYISTHAYADLDPMIRDYEPRQALLAGDEGLNDIIKILAQTEPFLADQGALMMEIAYDQHEPVVELFQQAGYLEDIQKVKDDGGHIRLIKAWRK